MNKIQEPIRIAHIMGKWLGGGVESVMMNYYRHIDKNKIQFDFICDNDSSDIPYEEIESLGGKVILIPPYQRVIMYHKELKKVLKQGNYKIVHSHINTLSVFSLFAAKCANVPVRISHSHSTTNKIEKKKNLMKQVLRPFSKLFATNYMCCSELAGRWLFGDKEYDKGSVYLLNNAIDLNKFRFDNSLRKKIREELKINDNITVIGHIGRFVEQKNHSFLVDIFNEIHYMNKDTVLLLVGQGPLQDKIKNKINKLGLDKYVIFLGQRKDANKIYQAFDMFLFPSIYEGLGMVLIEAQASGLNCIVSTEVPKAVKINDNIHFLNLSSGATYWAKEVFSIDKNKNDRQIFNEKIIDYGYDISVEAKKLTKKYLELFKNG